MNIPVDGSGTATIWKPHANPTLPMSMVSVAGLFPAAGVKISQVGNTSKCRYVPAPE